MARRGRPVLLDTSAIVEAWRIGSWKALAGGHRLETGETVTMETHTGFQRRRPEQQIDPAVASRPARKKRRTRFWHSRPVVPRRATMPSSCGLARRYRHWELRAERVAAIGPWGRSTRIAVRQAGISQTGRLSGQCLANLVHEAAGQRDESRVQRRGLRPAARDSGANCGSYQWTSAGLRRAFFLCRWREVHVAAWGSQRRCALCLCGRDHPGGNGRPVRRTPGVTAHPPKGHEREVLRLLCESCGLRRHSP